MSIKLLVLVVLLEYRWRNIRIISFHPQPPLRHCSDQLLTHLPPYVLLSWLLCDEWYRNDDSSQTITGLDWSMPSPCCLAYASWNANPKDSPLAAIPHTPLCTRFTRKASWHHVILCFICFCHLSKWYVPWGQQSLVLLVSYTVPRTL